MWGIVARDLVAVLSVTEVLDGVSTLSGGPVVQAHLLHGLGKRVTLEAHVRAVAEVISSNGATCPPGGTAGGPELGGNTIPSLLDG